MDGYPKVTITIIFNYITMRPLLYLLLVASILLLDASCSKNTDTNPCPDCPVIAAISPNSGSPGDVITITGEKFDGLEFVVFDNNQQVAIDPQMTTATQTKVAVPDLGKNGPVKVQVVRRFTSGGGGTTTLRSEENVTFRYVIAPEVISFMPFSGKKGDIITIRGLFFGTTPRVYFPNGEATEIILKSDTLIRVVLPGKAGSGPIRIVSELGLSATSTTSFEYQYTFQYALFLGAPNQPGYNINVAALDARMTKITLVTSDDQGNVYFVDEDYDPFLMEFRFSIMRVDKNPPHLVTRVEGGSYNGMCQQLFVDDKGEVYYVADLGSNERVLRRTKNNGLLSETIFGPSNKLAQAGIDTSGNIFLIMTDGLFRYNFGGGNSLVKVADLPVTSFNNFRKAHVLKSGILLEITESSPYPVRFFDFSNNEIRSLYSLPFSNTHLWTCSEFTDKLYFALGGTIQAKNGRILDGVSTHSPLTEFSDPLYPEYMGADALGNIYFRLSNSNNWPCLFKATAE